MEDVWMTQPQERAWRAFHSMRIQLLGHLSRRLAAESGLSEAEYQVLVVLSETPGQRLRSRDLGQELQWQRARVSHQLDRMERRGLLKREPTPEDARGCVAVLTAAGRSTIEEAARRHVADIKHCFANVLTPKQLDGLTEVATAITKHLQLEHTGEDQE